MPEISVIVPVYNAEKYLKCCIDSILMQTYSNFELILVDDGSTDSSGKICDEYAMLDNRIKVIHQENQGVSKARNQGVKKSLGQYITFVDSDEWLNVNFLQKLYSNLNDSDADISVMRICWITGEKQNQSTVVEETDIFNNRDAIKYYGNANDERFRGPVAKLILKSIVQSNPFPEDRAFAEDMAVVYKWYAMAGKIINSNLQFYYYRQNETSITKKPYGKFRWGNLKTLHELLAFLENEGYDSLYKKFLQEYLYDLCWQHDMTLLQLENSAVAKKIYEEIKGIFKKERIRCNITPLNSPHCYNLLFPKTMKVYWTVRGVIDILKNEGANGIILKLKERMTK